MKSVNFGRDDYSLSSVSDKLKDGEPVFLLRGSDPIAAAVVFHYAKLLEGRCGDPEMVHSARRQATEMANYQKEKLLPDLPGGLFRRGAKVWVLQGDVKIAGEIAGYDDKTGAFVVCYDNEVVKVTRESLEARSE